MTAFDMSDSVVAKKSEKVSSDKLAGEVFVADFRSYSQAQIRAIHSVTSDCGLPGVHLFDSDKQHDGIVSGALRVGGDLLQGAADELVHHPDRVIGNALIGVAAGALAVAAAPEVLIAGAVAGAGLVAFNAMQGHNPFAGIGDFVHNVGVVANPDGHSLEELKVAHHSVQDGGGVILDIAAGAAGGEVGAVAARAGIDALATSESSLLTRAASAGDETVARVSPATYDGRVGTSAAPGFNPENRLTGNALLERLETESGLSGYPGQWEQYAVRNLHDPQEISEFVNAATGRFEPNSVFIQLNKMAARGNGVVPGTEDAWETSLAGLRSRLIANGTNPAELAEVNQLARPDISIPRTSAWGSGRINPLTGDELISTVQNESQAYYLGQWDRYAVENLRDHQEIQDFVQALSRSPEYVGRNEELHGELMRMLTGYGFPGYHQGTREAWKLALRQLGTDVTNPVI